jgi:hypothetical protein
MAKPLNIHLLVISLKLCLSRESLYGASPGTVLPRNKT